MRAHKRILKRQPEIKYDIAETLRLLAENPFFSKLETHKLHGKLFGSWACSVGYSLRIIFYFVESDGEDNIFLIEIGSHEEVY